MRIVPAALKNTERKQTLPLLRTDGSPVAMELGWLNQLLSKERPGTCTSEAAKRNMVMVLRYYYRGIVDAPFAGDYKSVEIWKRQKELLEFLIDIGTEIVGSFYNGTRFDLDRVRSGLLEYHDDIVRFSCDGPFSYRCITGQLENVREILPKVAKRLGPFDTIVPVATGGFEAALLVNSLLRPRPNALVPMLYSLYSRNMAGATSPRPPANAPFADLDSMVAGKVLVTEDVVFTGNSITTVMLHASNLTDGEIYGLTPIVGKLLPRYVSHVEEVADSCGYFLRFLRGRDA